MKLHRLPKTINSIFKYLVFLIVSLNMVVFTQTNYNFYFGNLHSHTWYSDGNQDKTPSTYPLPVAKAIEYGRTQANNFNWLAITDHNHNEGLNMTMPYWRSSFVEADTANKDGIFVGFVGQEWGTISTGGHALVFGTDKLIGWNTGLYDVYVAKGDYANLWRVADSLDAFCYLAHPNNTDFGNLINTSYNINYDKVIQGTAIKSGPAFSTNTTQTDPSNTTYESYYHNLLKLGYRVAPTADQDNHYTNFGMSNQQRTVVLAPSFTRAEIINSLRNRRVYASEDHNVKVYFEIGNNLMGDIFPMKSPFVVRVKVSDSTPGDAISRIELRYGIPGSGSAPTVLTSVTNVDSLIYTITQAHATTYYYYVYVLQADGHRVWTAPMWIYSDDYLPVTFGSFNAEVDSANNNVVLKWTTISEINSYGFCVQRKKMGEPNFTTISDTISSAGNSQEPMNYTYTDRNINESGTYYYRIQQIDNDGSLSYSNTISIYFNYTMLSVDGDRINIFELSQNYPNPFNPTTTISFSLANAGYTTLKVYNLLGSEVATLFNGNAEAGVKYEVAFNAENLSSGMYFYKLQSGTNVEVKKMLLAK